MVVGTSATIQVAAAIAHHLFDQLGAAGTSALRFALAAVILLVVVRPVLRRDVATWQSIVGYGLSLAVLNVTFFAAIERIPMGIAVTFAFVPPLVMAIIASKRRIDIAWAMLAGAGVLILGGINPPQSVLGIALATFAGVAWVGVAYTGRQVGARTQRLEGLALAAAIASLATLPLGLPRVGALDSRALALGALIAVLGMIVPFALELQALRLIEPRIVAVVYSVDPAIGAIVGRVALGERITTLQLGGMAAVMIAAAGATTTASRSHG
jgi:inner membrane transporter RhtA